MEKTQGFDVVGFIIDFEGGCLSQKDIIDGFQILIDNGMVWQLQGFYGRTARDLIEMGYCTDRKRA